MLVTLQIYIFLDYHMVDEVKVLGNNWLFIACKITKIYIDKEVFLFET